MGGVAAEEVGFALNVMLLLVAIAAIELVERERSLSHLAMAGDAVATEALDLVQAVLVHLVDGTVEDVSAEVRDVDRELEAFLGALQEGPEGAEVDEIDLAGLSRVPAVHVRPFRVKEAAIAMEAGWTVTEVGHWRAAAVLASGLRSLFNRPESILLLDQLGVDPGDCVVVEDSPAGIASGLAAGATVVAVPHVAPLPDDRAVTVVASLVDLDAAVLADLVRERRVTRS